MPRNLLKMRYLLVAMLPLLPGAPALAGAWAEAGDAQLRSDVSLLTNAGVLTTLGTQWPLPWRGVAAALDNPALASQPRFIQEAARRVRARALHETEQDTLHVDAVVDATNRPALIRGFDAQGQGKAQAQAVLEYNAGGTTTHIAAGAITDSTRAGGTKIDLDGSYIAHQFGGAMVYGGYVNHWWGPGWVSALSASTNARPIPQIGIATSSPQRFGTPLLSWIGPWRAEFFVGILDDPRLAGNTAYNGFRFTFAPVKGLEIGLTRTQMLCGSGHDCNPLKAYFDIRNNDNKVNDSNDQGNIDVRYTNSIGGFPVEVYAQFMNEDTNPFWHSFTSHLVGASVWVPVGANTARLTTEYTSSIATRDIFSFNNVGYGISYNNSRYPDGMRYRDRTLGFSLDSDSRLLTLQANVTDAHDRSYTLSLHRARVSTLQTGAANIVSTAPVTINYMEARVVVPAKFADFSLGGRLQDDRPRPDRGFGGAVEAAVTFHLR